MFAHVLRRSGLFIVLGALLLSGSMLTAQMSGDHLPVSSLGRSLRTITPNDLKPAACNGITLNKLVTGSGAIYGTSQNNLILGSAGNDTIYAGSADNCIVAGGGYNTCYTSPGTNVYIDCQQILNP